NAIELSSRLPNVVLSEEVPYKLFSHADFTWAINVRTLLYDRVMEIIEKGTPSGDLDFDLEVKGQGHFEAKLFFSNGNSYFRLPNVVLSEEVPYKLFSHADFTWAINVRTLLYDRVMEIIEKFALNQNITRK
ncbi:hypothetical protein X777_16370, partial [Ooceraea biroi]